MPSSDGIPTALKLNTHDLNFRISWHPFSTLSFVTRYDFQLSTVHNQGASNNLVLGDIESANLTSHILSESVNWTPVPRMYFQLDGSYALDGAVNTGAAAWLGGTNMAPNLKNGYWTASALGVFVLDDKSDLQVQYTLYYADNYVNNAFYSQPYGTTTEENSVTATLSRQLTRSLKASLKYGFFQKHRPDFGRLSKLRRAHGLCQHRVSFLKERFNSTIPPTHYRL